MRRNVIAKVLSAVFLAGLVSGCSISSGKKHGEDNVSIHSAFGALDVKTDEHVVLGKMGLSIYPGATRIPKEGSNHGAADVDMSFGRFRLRVLAAEYHSPDSPEKVEQFYRNALARYSDVIACRDEAPIGSPTRTGLGLSCSDDNHGVADAGKNIHHGGELKLKAGSPSRQHIVAIEEGNGGTKFSLVSLELPHGDGDDD